MEIEKLLAELSSAVGIGNIKYATDIAKRELSKYAEVSDCGTIGIIGKIDKTIFSFLLKIRWKSSLLFFYKIFKNYIDKENTLLYNANKYTWSS